MGRFWAIVALAVLVSACSEVGETDRPDVRRSNHAGNGVEVYTFDDVRCFVAFGNGTAIDCLEVAE